MTFEVEAFWRIWVGRPGPQGILTPSLNATDLTCGISGLCKHLDDLRAGGHLLAAAKL